MSVYIESVILDNFFVTLLISKASYRALSLTNSRVRIYAATVLGTAVAVLYPLLEIHAGFLIAIKVGLCAALVLILFYKKTRLAPAAGVFIALTFTFGGLLFALGLAFYGDIEKALRLPVVNVPVGLILAGGWAAYILIKKVVRKLKRVRDISPNISAVEIEIFGKTVSGTAFLDTGNRLYDDKTGLPVIVLGVRAALQVLGDKGFTALMTGKEREIAPSARYMFYSGADAKKSKLLLLKPDAVRFYFGQTAHIVRDVMLGLVFTAFSDSVAYDVILHPAIVKI